PGVLRDPGHAEGRPVPAVDQLLLAGTDGLWHGAAPDPDVRRPGQPPLRRSAVPDHDRPRVRGSRHVPLTEDRGSDAWRVRGPHAPPPRPYATPWEGPEFDGQSNLRFEDRHTFTHSKCVRRRSVRGAS